MSKPASFSAYDGLARRAALAVPLAIALFLALNAIVGVLGRNARVDLTQDGLYTVGDATRKILSSIDEPITLRLYRSPQLIASAPVLKTYSERVDEMLRAYASMSNGKVAYEVVEPQPFSPEEDRAIAYRLRGFNVDRTGAQGYFGLVGTNSVDGLERMEFFDPRREDTLEYDLTSLVKRLSQPRKPRVGIIDSLNMFDAAGQGQRKWAIVNILGQAYDTGQLTGPQRAFGDIDLLMVVNPRGLSPADLYGIDQFALSGKPVFVFVDPVVEGILGRSQKPPPLDAVSSNLEPLLSAWGVDFAPDKVVGDRSMALRVTALAGRQRVLAPYLPWLQVREANFNHDDMATAKLKLMRVSSAGALSPKAGATTTFTPLISTTADAALLDAKQVVQRPNPNVFLDAFKPGGKPFAIAARVTGPAVSAFPDGEPAAEGAPPSDAPKPPRLTKSAKPIHVVVVADVDILNDDHMINDAGQMVSNNADFAMNVVDTLLGGAELASLRGRGVTPRPFTRVEALEQAADELYQARQSALTADLDKSQQDLQDMLAKGADGGGDATALTREQQGMLADLNRKIVDLRRQLRDVRAAVRVEIDRLETRVRLVNLLAVPLALLLMGLLVAAWRRARLARHVASRADGGGTTS